MNSKMKKSPIKSPLGHHVSPKKLSKKKLQLLNANNLRITDFYQNSENWRESDPQANRNLNDQECTKLAKNMEKKTNGISPEKSTRKYNLRQKAKKKNYVDEECDDDEKDKAYLGKVEKSKDKPVKNKEKSVKNKEKVIKNKEKAVKKDEERKSQSETLKNFLGVNNNVCIFKEEEISSLKIEEEIPVQCEEDITKLKKVSKPVKKERSKAKTKLSPAKTMFSPSKTKLSPTKTYFSPNNIIVSPTKYKLSPSKSEVPPKDSKRKPTKLNDTFKKYGLVLPSYEDLVRDEEELIAYSRKVNQACNVIEQNPITYISPLKLRPSNPPTLLSCEHLTPKEIKQLFLEYRPFCLDIINGKSDSERHRNFMMNNLSDNGSFLTYNISMIVFSTDQKQQLAKLCRKHFQHCDIANHTQYYFKVLLPELCLKIFMEEHYMSKDEAIQYLENRPVEDFK